MKLVLFDLGRTLEDQGVLLPGALKTLETITALRDIVGQPVVLALVSDYYMPSDTVTVRRIEERYLALLEALGIRRFFEPFDHRVTLSTHVGVFKPDRRIFEAVVRRSGIDLSYADMLFITENLEHVERSRELGMQAIHFKGPGQDRGDVDTLPDLVPRVEEFLERPPPRALRPAARSTWIACLRAGDGGAQTNPTGGRATSWARFGHDVLLLNDRSDWNEVSEVAGRRTDEIEVIGEVARRECLHLVIQKGRLFQQEHPEIPVLFDRGRYLVVNLEPDQVEVLTCEEPCYSILPLEDHAVVFEESPPSRRKEEVREDLQALLGTVSGARFMEDLRHLAAFPTRHSLSDHYIRAADWARSKLADSYLTRTEPVSIRGGGTSLNLIADRPGTGLGRRDVVLVIAHLDSVQQNGGAEAPAPGADDNASGVAGLLEMARTLRNHPSFHDLRFVLFGGEEQGLFGSWQYIDGLAAVERSRIRAVINMDMIGTLNVEEPTVLIEGAERSRALVEELETVAHTYTGLLVRTSLNAANSDHVPFLRRGIPAVLTIEGADHTNTDIHTDRDTVDKISETFALEILRMNTALVARHLGTVAA